MSWAEEQLCFKSGHGRIAQIAELPGHLKNISSGKITPSHPIRLRRRKKKTKKALKEAFWLWMIFGGVFRVSLFSVIFFAPCQILPQAPNTFVCSPATALIFSATGEVEVFSKNKKCNQKIVDFTVFGGQGRTIDLLDEQLVLLGENKLGGTPQYKSIHQPRKGLLGMKYSIESIPLGNSPYYHTSHVYGNELVAIGGESETEARLSSTVWNGLNLRWKSGSDFSHFAAGACQVKLAKDVFLLIGGLKRVNGSKAESNTVMKLNITEETAEELPPIKQSRAFHACEVYGRRILVSGGTQGQVTVADEVYSLVTNEPTILDMTSSLGRHGHSLLRLEETIFAFGGRLLGNTNDTSLVEWFDWSALRWRQHEYSLLSKNSSSLAVTSFPMSAVDCHAGCKCGLSGSKANTRIVGGTEAQVVWQKE